MAEKAPVVFAQAREVLAPGGTLFGATILGKGVDLSAPARAVVSFSNRRGVLCNLDDDLGSLDRVLARSFRSHRVEVVGTVALFAARVA